jgi:hypothetical protein
MSTMAVMGASWKMAGQDDWRCFYSNACGRKRLTGA